jgi:NDP-sugar pyrophosphorylase family protein
MSLSVSYFFNLESISFREIFDGCEFPWEALSKIADYLKNYPLGKIDAKVSPSAYLINPESITIGEGSIVEPGAFISGPCLIGKNCTIRHGAYIRGNFIAGDGCVIGHDTEVKNSIFLQNVHAAHFAYLGDSILGNSVNLGAGSKCANLKLDRGIISVSFQKKIISTGLKKFGAILGDGTQIGCNAVMNPGTLMGKSVFCHPCINPSGFIPSKSTVKTTSTLSIETRM